MTNGCKIEHQSLANIGLRRVQKDGGAVLRFRFLEAGLNPKASGAVVLKRVGRGSVKVCCEGGGAGPFPLWGVAMMSLTWWIGITH